MVTGHPSVLRFYRSQFETGTSCGALDDKNQIRKVPRYERSAVCWGSRDEDWDMYGLLMFIDRIIINVWYID